MTALSLKTPGVYLHHLTPAQSTEPESGIPAFLGYTSKADVDEMGKPISVVESRPLFAWAQFEPRFGPPLADSYLAGAVHGFFENGGGSCFVIRLENGTPVDSLRQKLKELETLDSPDLLCAPDIMRQNISEKVDRKTVSIMQAELLEHCDRRSDRFAILDAIAGSTLEEVLAQRQELSNSNGALYYPWIRVQNSLFNGFIPPCGQIAGVFAHCDQRSGVHKGPANEILEGVLDLEVNLNDAGQAELHPHNINCLRAFPGRGIRVWGALTLSRDPAWKYISVRRLFLKTIRWIEHNLQDVTLEPNDARLWMRIERELRIYLERLFLEGAVKGNTAREAFYVKCDAEINPAESRDRGVVVTEIGLAPAVPNEFIVVRIACSESGLNVSGPFGPAS